MKNLEYHREANRRSYQKHKAERLAKQKAYRQSESGKATQARKDKKQQKINPKHWGARAAVWRAVKSGRLERSDCQVCSSTKVEAHHHNGYEKEHWLDVVWLCNEHHVAAHREVIGNVFESPELLGDRS